eukprot:5587130-Amphidinium_carterae.1
MTPVSCRWVSYLAAKITASKLSQTHFLYIQNEFCPCRPTCKSLRLMILWCRSSFTKLDVEYICNGR